MQNRLWRICVAYMPAAALWHFLAKVQIINDTFIYAAMNSIAEFRTMSIQKMSVYKLYLILFDTLIIMIREE